MVLNIDELGDLELERVMILTGGCRAALADTIFRLPTRPHLGRGRITLECAVAFRAVDRLGRNYRYKA